MLKCEAEWVYQEKNSLCKKVIEERSTKTTKVKTTSGAWSKADAGRV